jgi:hypothetical protein
MAGRQAGYVCDQLFYLLVNGKLIIITASLSKRYGERNNLCLVGTPKSATLFPSFPLKTTAYNLQVT